MQSFYCFSPTLALYNNELDDQVELLVNIIDKAMNVSTCKLQLCAQSIPGFDGECKVAQMQACRLGKIYNQNPSVENWEKYQVARAVKGRLINKKKRNGYCEYCQKACDFLKAM